MPPSGFEQFRVLVLSDPSLQEQLREEADAGAFADRTVELGRQHGFIFTTPEVRDAVRAGRTRGGRWIECAARPELSGWIPIHVNTGEGIPTVEWCWFGDERLTQPFFEQAVTARMRRPFCRLWRHQTSIEALVELRRRRPGLKPDGFIFHVSRCGSTLLSQALAASPRHRVVSEAPPIDAVLRAPGVTDAQRGGWLEGMIHALGEPRSAEERYFIKFDSWHTLQFPLIRRVFPDVPCVFIYRDPVEVLVSHQRQPGAQMVPGLLGLNLPGTPSGGNPGPDEYKARVLAGFFEAQLRCRDSGRVLLLNYSGFPAAVFDEAARFFGVNWTAEERKRAESVARYDAKNPGLSFGNDALSKQREATPLIRKLADRRLKPLYEELEKARLDRLPKAISV